MSKKELPVGWFCEGQTDLMDLVESEHISGSVPPGEDARDEKRQQFYDSLQKTPEGSDG